MSTTHKKEPPQYIHAPYVTRIINDDNWCIRSGLWQTIAAGKAGAAIILNIGNFKK